MYKIGDWCFHDFELCQINRTEDNRVTEVTTGWINTSGHDLDVQPLTIRNKRISENVKDTSKKLHKEGNCGLNYPDIRRYLVQLWMEACNTPETESGDKKANEILKRIGDFENQVLEFTENSPVVDGVRILRNK